MPTKLTELEGYVLSSSKYGEKDAIISLLTKEGKISIKVPSGYDVKSKNHLSTLIFNKVHIDCMELSSSFLVALQTKTLINYTSTYEDLKKSLAIQVANELLIKFFQDRDREIPYLYYEKFLEGVNEGFDTLTLVLIFTSSVIRYLGYEPETGGCVNCGKKNNIISFSWDEGGYLCSHCAQELMARKEDNNYLKVLRYIFMVDEMRMKKTQLPEASCLRVLEEERHFLFEQLSTEIKSLDMYLENRKKGNK